MRLLDPEQPLPPGGPIVTELCKYCLRFSDPAKHQCDPEEIKAMLLSERAQRLALKARLEDIEDGQVG